jgi:integrase
MLAAREQAEQLRRQIDLGLDPLDERIAERTAPTVRDLFDRYAAEHLPTKAPRSAADDRSMWIKDILPALGPKKVSELRPQDCDKLHRTISLNRPTRANRVTEVLRKALKLAVRWGWNERNPASGGRRNPEPKRARCLGRDDVPRLIAALETHPERTSADALLFMLLTGCRRGEALGLSGSSSTWNSASGPSRAPKPSSAVSTGSPTLSRLRTYSTGGVPRLEGPSYIPEASARR